MVIDEKNPSTLIEFFSENHDVITEFLLSASRISLIFLDSAGNILDCNEFFLENAQLCEKPRGQPIANFLMHGFPVSEDLPDRQSQAVKLTFFLKDSISFSLSGHVLKARDRYLVFAQTFHLTDNELVTSMSQLTDELTNITRELNKKNKSLEVANETITTLMNTDPLTGLTNRRQFKILLDNEMSKAKRHERFLSALMFDIDNFKAVNDTYGHDVGDKVLISVANTLRAMCRNEDIVARYGGEEFLMILPDSSDISSLECAERFRLAIYELSFPEINWKITVSVGVTLFLADDTEETFIKRSDVALYEAKDAGRNCVVLK